MNNNDEFKPQAYCVWSNFGGCQIELNDAGDAVRYQIYDWAVSDWTEILYDNDGRAYFIAKFVGGRNKWAENLYLEDFIKF